MADLTREQCDHALRRMGYALLAFSKWNDTVYYASAAILTERPTAIADTQGKAFGRLVERVATLTGHTDPDPDLSHLSPRDRLAALVARHGAGFNAIIAAARDAMPVGGDAVRVDIDSIEVRIESEQGAGGLGFDYDFAKAVLAAVDGAIEDESEDDE